MKQIITATVLLISTTAFAQVGINNTSPKATLDITAKTSGTKPEGLIIPQLAGDNIRTATTAGVYGTNQKGLIVYASSADTAPTGATANITVAGYYYFDGTNWQKISTGNTLNISLANGNIYIGNSSNVATAVMPTGDVAISNTGATSIGAGKVTNTHLASAAALTIKGNATNATASPTDIAAGTDGYVLRRSGTSLGFGTVATAGIADGAVTASKLNQMSATSGQVLGWNGSSWVPTADAIGISTTLNSGNILVGSASNVATAVSPTGDVAISNTGATSIGAGKVTNTHMASAAALTIKGNATNAAASPTDIAAGTDGYVLRRSGTSLGFGTVATAGIADGAVTASKLNQMSATSGQVLGWNGSSWVPTADATGISTTLNSGNILVGSASNVATAVVPTGDVAISNTGATSIGAGKVTNTHMASVAALTVKGNATNAAASPTDIAAGTDGYVLRRSGTSLGFGTVATAGIADGAVTTAKIQGSSTNGQVLTTNASGVTSWVTPVDNNTTYTGSNSINLNGTSFERTALTGDVTASANSNTTTIAANAVNSAKIADGTVANADLANMNALTVKGNATNAAASPIDIAAGTDGYVLRRSGTSLGFGTVDTAGITDGAVTTAKIANDAVTSTQIATGAVSNADLASAAALTVKGNATNAAASPTDIAAGTDGYVLRRSGTALGFGTVDTAGITDGAVTSNKILDGTVANADLASGTGGIYKGSGALAGNTTVAQNANTLDFTSTATTGTSHFTVDGTTLNVDAVNNRVGIGTATPQKILHVNANNNSIRFENLPSLSSGTTSTGLVVDANGDVYKNNTVSTEGQILRIGLNSNTYNAGSEAALRFNLNNDATEMGLASNGASNFINTINGCTITENVALTGGTGSPSRTTDRITLQAGVYKVQVRIVGNFGAQNNGNNLTIKSIVGNNEYSLISFSNSSNAAGSAYFDDYIILDTTQSIDFTIVPLTNNFTISSQVSQSYRSLIMIQRLR